jgi:hypothetical protein
MIITCHQPNFFPWLPFFKKMESSDVFVIMQNAQYTRNQFQNRFKYRGFWKTMSVNHGELRDNISSKKYVKPESDWYQIKKSIQFGWMSNFDNCIGENLAETNTAIIAEIKKLMGIPTLLELDGPILSRDATENLINICLKYEATTYLSGPSGKAYLNLEAFRKVGIQVEFFDAISESPHELNIVDYLQSSFYEKQS